MEEDEGIMPTTAEGLANLKPVFRPDGEITAGNACPLNDGAAAVMVMSDTKAAELGLIEYGGKLTDLEFEAQNAARAEISRITQAIDTYDWAADFNVDGVINLTDITNMAQAIGAGCP